MAYEAKILLGRITKVSGYDGDVIIRLEKVFLENIPEQESVFLEIDGKPVPFFIASYDYSGADILRLNFDGYSSYDKVSEFVGCNVFLTGKSIENDSSGYLNELSGYTVLRSNKSLVGTVAELLQNPGQWLLVIKSPEGKEILVPFHEHFIVKLDNKKKYIIMDLPEGIEEIN